MWKPGSLALTNRRLWFFPADWNDEPWFLRLDDVGRIAPERPIVAELAPIRNWPEHLQVSSRVGPDAVFAMAEPTAVLAWFDPPVRRDGVAHVAASADHPAGVSDE
jgi:hypothetical protein